MKVNYSLPEKSIKKIAELLSIALANLNVLYIKTRNFHWNMEDPRFYFLHKMLEEQYNQLEEAADLVAEKIRQLGVKSPASMNEFLKLATIKEAGIDLSGNEMLKNLADSHEMIIKELRDNTEQVEKLGDYGTVDLLTELLRGHEKTAWILRSHL